MIEANQEYFVFISYSSLDNEWAIWLRHELEHYHLPASFNGRTDVRDNLRKVFRDRDELSAGPEWDEQVGKALAATNNLIVICSPNAAKSEAVNKEVEAFIALGKEDHIFPFIVEGNKPEDCFPPALNHLKLGGDVNKDGGRDSAFVKVVAGMLKVGFPSLWERYEKEKAEEERKIREQRDKLLIMQSRFLAEKANDLVDKGDSYTARLLALEALPKDLENPNRPYTVEAESGLRKASNTPIIILDDNSIPSIVKYTPDRRFLVYVTDDAGDIFIKVWNPETGKLIRTIGYTAPRWMARTQEIYRFMDEFIVKEWHKTSIEQISFSLDGKYIVSYSPSLLAPNLAAVVVNDLTTGKFICKIKPKQKLHNITFSDDNRFVIAQSDGEKIYAWDISTGICVEPISEKQATSYALFLSNKIIETSDFIIHSEFMSLVNKYLEGINIKKIYYSDDEHVAFVSDNTIGIINMHYYNSLLSPVKKIVAKKYSEKESYGEIFSPSKRIRVSIKGDDYVKYIDINNNGVKGRLLSELDPMDNIDYVVFSPNEEYMVSISGMNLGHTVTGYVHEVWDINNLKLLCKIEGQHSKVNAISFHPNNNVIASVSDYNSIKVYDVQTGILLVEYPYLSDIIIDCISFSDDGKNLYIQEKDGNTYKWAFPELQELINNNLDCFSDQHLTPEERKKYYLD